MSSSKAGSVAVDQGREILCREVARCINAGHFVVRVRIIKSAGRPAGVRISVHQEDGWKKHFEAMDDRALASAFDETLAMLASKAHRDQWSAKRRSHADGYDIDLQFHPEKFKDRLGAKLKSVVTGTLFRDSHDSKQDKRRSIRTPRQTRVGR